MKKEYVSYGLIGIVAGLVLGFIVFGNGLCKSGGASPQVAAGTEFEAGLSQQQ